MIRTIVEVIFSINVAKPVLEANNDTLDSLNNSVPAQG